MYIISENQDTDSNTDHVTWISNIKNLYQSAPIVIALCNSKNTYKYYLSLFQNVTYKENESTIFSWILPYSYFFQIQTYALEVKYKHLTATWCLLR